MSSYGGNDHKRGDSQEKSADDVTFVCARESKAPNKNLAKTTDKAGLQCWESLHGDIPCDADGAGLFSVRPTRMGQNWQTIGLVAETQCT
jgi:hypothetical protein